MKQEKKKIENRQWRFDICFGDEKDKQQGRNEVKVFEAMIKQYRDKKFYKKHPMRKESKTYYV